MPGFVDEPLFVKSATTTSELYHATCATLPFFLKIHAILGPKGGGRPIMGHDPGKKKLDWQ